MTSAGDATTSVDSGISSDTGPGKDGPEASVLRCPEGMVELETFCIDRYEAYLVELQSDGTERAHSPFATVDGLRIRAKVASNVSPQGYISQLQASAACAEAQKRLCSKSEFARACRGSLETRTYPYGTKYQKGACNEGKGSTVAKLFGSDSSKWTYANFNDPRLNQLSGTLASTGAYVQCVTDEGVFDLVGNLHEWGADSADSSGHGRFRGGFYGDAEVNGSGCLYETKAHELSYHDYSTGFRCCADLH